jgi:hypothetical protein
MLAAEAESLLAQRLLSEALAAFDRAEAEEEDFARCSAGRWQAHMLLGEFERAWNESDAIHARNTPDPHRFWNGEDLAGKRVILRCLHGLGDAVQFLRYVPMLNACASHVTVQVPPALLELAPHFAGVTDVITWSRPECPEPAWDVQIEINELPYIFRTQLSDLPITTNYLVLPPELLAANRPRPQNSSSFRIGLVWSCGTWNPARNIQFKLLGSILDQPDCEFWNLQGGDARADCTHPAVHQAERCAGSLLNLAGLIAQLDLILTADTLAAHLAGALGTPAFVLLQHAADWRWLHARNHSPWYPSVQLFRQPRPCDWQSAIRMVQSALPQFARRSLIA